MQWIFLRYEIATSDGCAYYDRTFMIIKDSEILKKEAISHDGFIPLTLKEYKKLANKYELLKRSEEILDRPLTQQEAKSSRTLILLAEGWRPLGEFINIIYSMGKQVYNYNKMICINLPDDQENPAMRAWSIGSLRSQSTIHATSNLNDETHLITMPKQNLEQVLRYAAKKFIKDEIY